MKNKRIILSLLVILIISWGSYKGYEINLFQKLNPVLKHSINFCLLISVALFGYYALTNFSEKWMRAIWVLAYSFVIILLIIAGLIDVIHRIENNIIRDSIVPFRMFFTSPLPLLILLVIKKMVKENPVKKQQHTIDT